jgi:23S rRNA (uracil1939-C5)-methyltransferase
MKRQDLPVIEDILITDAGAEGKAVGHWNEKVVFLRNAVPGDIVDIQLTKQKKSFCEGKLLRVKKASDKREEPFCSHFGICGGCKWQNMKYEHQLFYKQKMVEDNLLRIGKLDIEDIIPILPSPLTKHYRNKMEYSFSNVRYLTREDMDLPDEEKNMNALGFHVAPSFFRVLDLQHCHLPPDLSDRIRNEVRKYALENQLEYYDLREHQGFLRNMYVRSTTLGHWMLIMVFAREDKEEREKMLAHLDKQLPEITSLMYVINDKRNDTISDMPVYLWRGDPFMMEEMEGIKFKIGPVSFFQTNSVQALELYRITRDFAGLQASDVVYDLYTGTGTIANFIARYVKKVVGIEYVPSAIEDAQENAEINEIKNTFFFAGDIAKVLDDEFILANGQPDVIITDPPRAGMHPKVVEQILKMEPQRIVYVSCNPATQARDAAILKEKYHIHKVQAVDMFPHTQHVECVMLLELKK